MTGDLHRRGEAYSEYWWRVWEDGAEPPLTLREWITGLRPFPASNGVTVTLTASWRRWWNSTWMHLRWGIWEDWMQRLHDRISPHGHLCNREEESWT